MAKRTHRYRTSTSWRFAGLLALAVALLVGSARRERGAEAGQTNAPPVPPYRVIAHHQHETTSVDRQFLARAFLKKVTNWPNGEGIRPVDQLHGSPVRNRFSEEVLGRSVLAVRNYWQQLIFSGRAVPPPELDSDEAVVRFVLRTPGAIGYVSGAADVRNARVINFR